MVTRPPVVLIVDADLALLTPPIVDWTSIELEQEFNSVGAGTFTAPATAELIEAVQTDQARVVITRRGEAFTGGPIEQPGGLDWTANEGAGLLRVGFGTWEALLAERLTYPDPNVVAGAEAFAEYFATLTNAEVTLRDLVNLNAGPGALTVRRVPNLVLGGLASVGSLVDLSTRYEVLTDTLRRAALAGGGLGFRVVQVGTTLEFQVYDPLDLTDSVRFSRALGNLRAFKSEPQAPVATVAIVGGDGTGAAREIVERTNASAVTRWGRREVWVGESGTTLELQQAGDAALIEQGEKAGMTATAVETDQAAYGTHYLLGDLVAVEPVPGYATSGVVSAVRFTASPDEGEQLSITVGTGPLVSDTQLALVRQIERRLSRLERG